MKTCISILIILFFGLFTFASNPILFPKSNDKVCINKTCTIKWDANYFFSDRNSVRIIFYKGSNKILTVNSTANDGSWDWKVSENLQPGDNYRVFIKGFREVTDPEYYSGYFKLIKCGLQLARNSKGRPISNINNSSVNVKKPDTSQVTAVDICENYKNYEYKLFLKKFTMTAADPYNRNSHANGDIIVVNRGNRCVKALLWRLFNDKGDMIAVGHIKPQDYGKSKWLLKGGEKIKAVFSIPGSQIWAFQDSIPSQCLPPFLMCNKVKLFVIPYGNTNYNSNTMETIVGWAFEKDL